MSKSGKPAPPASPSGAIQLPELLQGSLAVAFRPSSPPFSLVRGRGNLTLALIYVAAGAALTGLIHWALSGTWRDLAADLVGFVLGFAAFVFAVAAWLKLNPRDRADFATAAALYWVPAALALGFLSVLLARISPLLVSPAYIAQALLWLGFSQLALKTLFGLTFERTFLAAALGLLANGLAIGLAGWLITRISS
ncbi:MAG TPA: hypothetical protein VD886_12355 [Herpetosiphonaceae bacterium]|nr:hypothetical protein [Herpetosiphonaceae bacterium]